MTERVVIGGDLRLHEIVSGDAVLHQVISGQAGAFLPLYPDPYTGPFEVTPSGETQVLNTSGLMMPQSVTINPIPSNYGLITWNGSTLTVS